MGRPITTTANYVNGGAVDNQTNLRTVTTYDAAGNRVAVTDPNLNATQFQYDLLNRLVSVTDPLTGTTRYGYDGAGALLTLTDANNHGLTRTYDLLNRLLAVTDALQHVTQYTYDAAGDQVSLLDAKSKQTTFTFDLLNRPTNIAYPAPDASVSFAYDVIGRRTVMTDGQGITTWLYDGVDRPTSINQPYTGTVQYTYDSAGDRLTLTYPDGKVVHYTYDLATRLAQVSDWLTQTTSYVYNPIGQPLTVTLPNGVASSFGYDNAERLSAITHQGVTQTLGSYAYALDAVGNRIGVTETLLLPGTGISTTTISYGYDPLYRLTRANYSTGAVFTYTFDAVGNRLTQTTLTNTTAYTYDIANRLVNVAGQAYTWDNNGNMLSDGVMSYAYDSANRPVTITQGANTYVFGYDGMGDRRWQSLNGVPVTYTLDLNASLVQVLADGNGNTYLYGNGRIDQQSAAATGYFLPDALGSVRQLSDTSGNVTLAERYDPYGNVLSSAGTGTSIYGFTGEVTDGTGLVYLRARMYSPTTGRFFVQDSWRGNPQSPQTYNPYLYSNNNPVDQTDPSGRCAGFAGYGAFATTLTGLIPSGWSVTKPWQSIPAAWKNAWDTCAKSIQEGTTALQSGDYGRAALQYSGITAGLIQSADFLHHHTRNAEILTWHVDPDTGQPVCPLDYLKAYLETGVPIEIGLTSLIPYAELANPEAIGPFAPDPSKIRGWNEFHYDLVNGGPGQLNAMYPDTEFKYTAQGAAGVDVKWVGGPHPSTYPNSTWDPANDFGDFKANSNGGYNSFWNDWARGKFPPNTQPLPYDKNSYVLLPKHEFGP